MEREFQTLMMPDNKYWHFDHVLLPGFSYSIAKQHHALSMDGVVDMCITDKLIPLLYFPVPDNLTRAFGYTGFQRFVAFHWSSINDELAWTDGIDECIGANDNLWLKVINHPAIKPYLSCFHFGDSNHKAKHLFVVDRSSSNAYVGDYECINQFFCEDRYLEEKNNVSYFGIESSDKSCQRMFENVGELVNKHRGYDEDVNDVIMLFYDHVIAART